MASLASVTPARMRRALPYAALGLALATAASIAWVDEPLARYLADHGAGWRAVWNAALAVGEDVTAIDVWKWLAGTVVLAIGAVAYLVPRWRHAAVAWWFVGASHFAARLSGNELKTALGRLRPSQWLPHGGPTFFAGGISMPSGHVAHFLGFVLPLAVVKPRIGLPLLVVPAVAGWARVADDAHFLGDVLAGAAWTTFITWLCALALRIPRAPRPDPRDAAQD